MPVEILANIFRERLSAVAPAAGLEAVVEGYYLYACGQTTQQIWATLDGHPALLFLLDAPYDIRFTGACTAAFEHAFCCCYGLQHTYITPWPRGMRMLVVKFTCNGLYRLLQRPLNMVTATPLVAISGIWGKEGDQLATAIRNAGELHQQVALLDAFLLGKLPASKEAGYLVETAVSCIREYKGLLSVQALCGRLGVNYKWLERNFRKQLGVTPKHYINTIRFLHAYFSAGNRAGSLTHVALEHGYYDQNHFIKEYRKHTGKPPSLH